MSEAGESPRDPMRAAQANMRQKAIETLLQGRRGDGGGRALRAEPRRPPGAHARPQVLAASSRALMADAAAEWERQRETIDPADMPLTRLLNSAIDGVAHTMAETRADILRYAGSDLVCYRAEEPDALVARQAHAFDPVLRWAAEQLGACLDVTAGIVHVAQPPEALAAIAAALEAYDDPAALAALSVMTTLTGSALLALAVARASSAGRRVAGRTCR